MKILSVGLITTTLVASVYAGSLTNSERGQAMVIGVGAGIQLHAMSRPISECKTMSKQEAILSKEEKLAVAIKNCEEQYKKQSK